MVAGPLIGDGVVLTVVDSAAATPFEERGQRSRRAEAHHQTRDQRDTDARLFGTLSSVAQATCLQMAADDDEKLDPNPVRSVELSRRDRVGTVQVMVLAPADGDRLLIGRRSLCWRSGRLGDTADARTRSGRSLTIFGLFS